MTALILTPNIEGPDDFYAELLTAHQKLSKQESEAFNARLILILMNHIGDPETLRQALEAAAPSPGREETGR